MENSHMGSPQGHYIWIPSLTPVLKDSKGKRPPSRPAAKGNGGTQQGLPVGTLWRIKV